MQDGEEEEHKGFHARQAEEVDEKLFEPPGYTGRGAVVAAFDGLGGAREGSVGEGDVEDFEEEVEDWDADCCLGLLLASGSRWAVVAVHLRQCPSSVSNMSMDSGNSFRHQSPGL